MPIKCYLDEFLVNFRVSGNLIKYYYKSKLKYLGLPFNGLKAATLNVRFFNRALESRTVCFAFGAVGFVSTWVTLLYAVGVRLCGAASIGRRGLESLAFWARFETGAGDMSGFIQTSVHAGTILLGSKTTFVMNVKRLRPPFLLGILIHRSTCDA